jgi:hypothetical protein
VKHGEFHRDFHGHLHRDLSKGGPAKAALSICAVQILDTPLRRVTMSECTCATCVHGGEFLEDGHPSETRIECRFNPPAIVPTAYGAYSGFPDVAKTSWCRMHETEKHPVIKAAA